MGEQPTGIYDLLIETEKRKKSKIREELLRIVGVVEEYFEEGSIKIDKFTCRGAECLLCIDACPTNALYWDQGKVKIENDLCIYCSACVLSCIVDHCIVVTRKRASGETETFGTPREAIILYNCRAGRLRGESVNLIMAELAKARRHK